MAQSTLLDSQVQNRKGFIVSVERTIRLAEFESLHIALSESFPEGMDHDQAYKLIHERVAGESPNEVRACLSCEASL